VSGKHYHLRLGDSAELLPKLRSESIDALVTDPPAGIGFMGKEWDDFRRSRNASDVSRDNPFGRLSARGPEYGRKRDAFVTALTPIFAECFRALKPGAHGLVWAIPRTSHWTATALEDAGFQVRDVGVHLFGTGFPKSKACLKPGAEHWIVRKGGCDLNIDACRLPGAAGDGHWTHRREIGDGNIYGGGGRTAADFGNVNPNPAGRWPANVTLDEGAAAALGEVARFFYVAKASKKDRGGGNNHPTVKPIKLMRWLCRLITPPNGIILDPFTGSGSTGVAALLEGFRFLGIEREAEYMRIAEQRIAAALNGSESDT